jgi:hypothetical protein
MVSRCSAEVSSKLASMTDYTSTPPKKNRIVNTIVKTRFLSTDLFFSSSFRHPSTTCHADPAFGGETSGFLDSSPFGLRMTEADSLYCVRTRVPTPREKGVKA